MTPCIITLIYLERKAVRGEVSLASSKEVRRHAKAVDEVNRGEKSAADLQPLLDEPWALKLKRGLREIDAFGLLLLGFGWSLVSSVTECSVVIASDSLLSLWPASVAASVLTEELCRPWLQQPISHCHVLRRRLLSSFLHSLRSQVGAFPNGP